MAPNPPALLSQGTYTPEWRAHVLSHLPFYTKLLPHFVELTLARLSFRGDAAVTDLVGGVTAVLALYLVSYAGLMLRLLKRSHCRHGASQVHV